MNPSQSVLDFEAARRRRDEGIQRAVDNANIKIPRWADTAFSFLVDHSRANASFTAEDVRIEAEKADAVPPPPDKSAWGGVFQRASRAGLITRIGFVTARDPKVHCNNISLWRSNVHDAKPANAS